MRMVVARCRDDTKIHYVAHLSAAFSGVGSVSVRKRQGLGSRETTFYLKAKSVRPYHSERHSVLDVPRRPT